MSADLGFLAERDRRAWENATHVVAVNEAHALLYDGSRGRYSEFISVRPGWCATGMWSAELPALSAEHAEWLRDYLTAMGVPKGALRVRERAS